MKKIIRLTALVPVFVAILFMSCTKTDPKIELRKDHNFMMAFGTSDATADAAIVQDMRLFTFYQGTASDRKFRKEVFNITRQDNGLSATVETGLWHLAALSAPAGTPIISPDPALPMELAPMYKYAPTISALTGQSTNAEQIFFVNFPLPNAIVASPDANDPVDVSISRNVAKIELVISKSTATFKKDGTHRIKVYSVPSTISYTGALLPDKTDPDTLSLPLEAKLQLKEHQTEKNYLESETITFIIPAHKGVDDHDVTSLKMLVNVELERVNGTKFTKTKVLPVVAVCNQILRVNITVDDGIEFGTEIKKWDKVTINESVGEPYTNWLYVKKGATGNGLSWRDALPSITAAVNKVEALRDAGYNVYGILVAGGSDKVYTEGIKIPAETRIFGGWEGKPGTEFLVTDLASAPYTSTVRDLSKYKAYLSLDNTFVMLETAGSVLDGFCITGSSSSSLPMVKVDHSGAWLNAVEIVGLMSMDAILQMKAGTASNILISGCNKGVSLTGNNTKLINATIANNAGKLSVTSGASLLNSVVWWGSKTGGGCDFTGGTVQYCAIQGDNESYPKTGNNVPINAINTAWFTNDSNVPGPNFNESTSSRPYYSAADNQAPMLGRGKPDLFNTNISATMMPAYSRKDINGNPRIVTVNSVDRIDMGCYQEADLRGFNLAWASERIYVSSKNGYITDAPLLLPVENLETKIGLTWSVSVNTLQFCNLIGGPTVSGKSTDGEYILVGSFQLKTIEAYTLKAERKCGSVRVHTNLGAYLPDVEIEVWQTPGASSVWTAGYVGSFHKNDETLERYITGDNTGAWTVRVIKGIDWIKIDGKGKGADNQVVEDTFGGVVTGTGNIKFRVGMKSVNPGLAPRYGLIIIQRTGGIAMFFVRQGEEADYLYRTEDPRTVQTQQRLNAKKFSPYNVVADEYYTYNGATVSNYDITGPNKGRFIDYPTKVASYFQINKTVSYVPRTGVTPDLPGTPWSSWSASREVCPPGYRHPTEPELVESLYNDRENNITDNSSAAANNNFVWGRYADGYFDKISASNGDKEVGVGYNRATYGVLMVNHYNMASIFFPATSVLSRTTVAGESLALTPISLQTYTSTGTSYYDGYCFYHTSTLRATTGACDNWHTHWVGSSTSQTTGHIGMSCTVINSTTYGYRAAPVRCVKILND